MGPAEMEYGLAFVVDDLRSLALEEPGAVAAAVYDRPIALRQLFIDPESGEEHYVVRYPAGVNARAHRHTAAHTIVVLEGELDANGHVIGPGSYAHFPDPQGGHPRAATEHQKRPEARGKW